MVCLGRIDIIYPIDYEELWELVGFRSMHDFAEAYRGWIDEAVKDVTHCRDGKWTESIAVDSASFVATTKDKLGFKAKGRRVIGEDGTYELKESPASYNGVFGHEKAPLSPQNEHLWEDTD
jgi:putative transposase